MAMDRSLYLLREGSVHARPNCSSLVDWQPNHRCRHQAWDQPWLYECSLATRMDSRLAISWSCGTRSSIRRRLGQRSLWQGSWQLSWSWRNQNHPTMSRCSPNLCTRSCKCNYSLLWSLEAPQASMSRNLRQVRLIRLRDSTETRKLQQKFLWCSSISLYGTYGRSCQSLLLASQLLGRWKAFHCLINIARLVLELSASLIKLSLNLRQFSSFQIMSSNYPSFRGSRNIQTSSLEKTNHQVDISIARSA